jgi:hypothetical protein
MTVKEKIGQSFSIALALQSVSAAHGSLNVGKSAQATESRIRAESSPTVTLTPDVLTTTVTNVFSQPTEFERVVSIVPDRWEPQHEERFDELVEKEALKKISASELRELDSLQRIRSKLVNPPQMDEVLARLRLDKLDRELLRVLQRNVRIQEF